MQLRAYFGQEQLPLLVSLSTLASIRRAWAQKESALRTKRLARTHCSARMRAERVAHAHARNASHAINSIPHRHHTAPRRAAVTPRRAPARTSFALHARLTANHTHIPLHVAALRSATGCARAISLLLSRQGRAELHTQKVHCAHSRPCTAARTHRSTTGRMRACTVLHSMRCANKV